MPRGLVAILRTAVLLAAVPFVLPACGGGCCDGPAGAGPLPQTAPAFSLEDVNDTSHTHQETLSPRDYMGWISVWYFGHST